MKLAAVRTARHRDPAFPQPAAFRGLERLYDEAALTAWYRDREEARERAWQERARWT